MATDIYTSLVQQADNNGIPLSGGSVTVYEIGTTTKRTIYSDATLLVTATNPIVLTADGSHDMRYTAAGSYKVVIKDADGVPVRTRDNVDGGVPVGTGALAVVNGGTGATTEGAALANLGAATSEEVADLAAQVASLAGAQASIANTHLATGSTGQRPDSPVPGDVRHNTTLDKYEGYIDDWYSFFTTQDLATQAQMEAATNNVTLVTPLRLKNHPGVAKVTGCIRFSAGTPAASNESKFNIASVTDNSTGDTTITFTVPFSSTNFVPIVTMLNSDSAGTDNVHEIKVRTMSASTVRITTSRSTTSPASNRAAVDLDFFIACFGDQ